MPRGAASRLGALPGEYTFLAGSNAKLADSKNCAPATFGFDFHNSVGAIVRQSVGGVIRVIWAIEAVVIKAATDEMTSANAKVIPAEASDVTSADATDVTSAKTSDVTSAEAADVATTKATDVTSAEAAHVAATKATTVPAATTTAAGFCTGGNKAAGKQRTCQYHYQSSSHDISPLGWADIPPQDLHQMSAGLTGQTPTSLWTGDGNSRLPSLLKSLSISGALEPKVACA
jgi:hypothetical protein